MDLFAECSSAQVLNINSTLSGELTSNDCIVSELVGGQDSSYTDQYQFALASDQTISIEMQSDALDSFLQLWTDGFATLLQTDDDGGIGLNSAITDVSLTTGTYLILANSATQQAATGEYSLTLSATNSPAETIVVSSVLPASRSVQVGTRATAFATIINAGSETARACRLSLSSQIDATLTFQTTDPATNMSVGIENAPTDIAAGAFQSFIFAITPNSAFEPEEVELSFDCANTDPAPTFVGLNTLLLSSELSTPPDIIALAATPIDPGVINLPDTTATGFDVFSVASVNLGTAADLTITADSGGIDLGLTILMCQTNPVTGACINPEVPSTFPIETNVANGETPTFAMFVTSDEQIDFSPAVNRIFVRFKESTGLTRGATSVAVRTAL